MLRQTYSLIRCYIGTLLAMAMCLSLSGCSSSPTPSIGSQTSSASSRGGAEIYEGKLVRRPGPTPEDGKVYLVDKGKKRWVVDAKWLSAHGFRFPEDVSEIPASVLNMIPDGEPIQ
jgi:hypothetical protein